jgi:hypothetical protein
MTRIAAIMPPTTGPRWLEDFERVVEAADEEVDVDVDVALSPDVVVAPEAAVVVAEEFEPDAAASATLISKVELVKSTWFIQGGSTMVDIAAFTKVAEHSVSSAFQTDHDGMDSPAGNPGTEF